MVSPVVIGDEDKLIATKHIWPWGDWFVLLSLPMYALSAIMFIVVFS
jgi:hypothetical protein